MGRTGSDREGQYAGRCPWARSFKSIPRGARKWTRPRRRREGDSPGTKVVSPERSPAEPSKATAANPAGQGQKGAVAARRVCSAALVNLRARDLSVVVLVGDVTQRPRRLAAFVDGGPGQDRPRVASTGRNSPAAHHVGQHDSIVRMAYPGDPRERSLDGGAASAVPRMVEDARTLWVIAGDCQHVGPRPVRRRRTCVVVRVVMTVLAMPISRPPLRADADISGHSTRGRQSAPRSVTSHQSGIAPRRIGDVPEPTPAVTMVVRGPSRMIPQR